MHFTVFSSYFGLTAVSSQINTVRTTLRMTWSWELKVSSVSSSLAWCLKVIVWSQNWYLCINKSTTVNMSWAYMIKTNTDWAFKAILGLTLLDWQVSKPVILSPGGCHFLIPPYLHPLLTKLGSSGSSNWQRCEMTVETFEILAFQEISKSALNTEQECGRFASQAHTVQWAWWS